MNIPDRICDWLHSWAMARMARSKPDFVVNGAGGVPYLQRWWVIPQNKFFNIYLHHFISDDEDRALHNHPWVNLTIVLQGSYYEHLPDGLPKLRQRGQIVRRLPSSFHRISLVRSGKRRLSATSLFITGPVVQVWGFACPKGFRPWYEFVSARDKDSVGRGCDP